ncbi:FadR/GntR family transcriptional regulator [Aquimarina litoralis]|uniref:FadR/GntR family transcriptional regulator n=1 Tax=Aquimarina litoralis TaxID=584605 RepID=UPI001C5A28EE|nr:FadR/GntR family transcriptional regulator [Aquimarina litoralis]MBW1295116.1 FCD domain-containing protein [Aquimarina litoralis]
MKTNLEPESLSPGNEIETVISKIRDLIINRQLEPGDKLPSERALSEKFNVSRSQLRLAIQKLEFYGLVKKYPKSGTFVSKIGVGALNSMMANILHLQTPDFKSLVETRLILETKAVKLAAIRRTEKQLYQIELAHEAYINKSINGENAIDEDLLFHLKLAEASGNSVINSLMLVITPEIITNFVTNKICDKNSFSTLIKEHQDIVTAIKNSDPDQATQSLKIHFNDLYQYCKTK